MGLWISRVLDPVGELGEDLVGDVGGVLADKVDAHALGADELHHLDDLLKQGLGHTGEQQVRLIEEEHHSGLFQIAHLRQLFEELGEHPEQEGGVNGGTLDQPRTGEDVYVPPAVPVGADPVEDVQGGLAEDLLPAFVLKGQERALDGADAGGGDVAVAHGEFGAVVAHELEHGAQVLQIKEQKAVVIRYPENDAQYARLDVGESEKPGQQRGAHVGHGDADGVAGLAEDIPEACGISGIFKAFNAKTRDALAHIPAVLSGLAHAGDVPLDVREKNGYAQVGEGLRQHLHGDGLAGAGSAGDEPVAVRHIRKKVNVFLSGISDP